MKAGRRLLHPKNRSVDTHLWVVISDPQKGPARVIMVSVTTSRGSQAGRAPDHAVITPGDSQVCVAYHEGLEKNDDLRKILIVLRDGRPPEHRGPFSGELLAHRSGMGVDQIARHMKYKYVEILLEQEVIDREKPSRSSQVAVRNKFSGRTGGGTGIAAHLPLLDPVNDFQVRQQLLIPQRLDRVEHGGAAGGVDAEDDARHARRSGRRRSATRG